MLPRIIAISGFMGSGKDTVGAYLIKNHGFVKHSFGAALKDAVAAIFGWDREMLEGATNESRAWREQVDTRWAECLNMPQLTPRYVLQYIGTDMFRRNFHTDIWIAAAEFRIKRELANNRRVVLTDCRFPNEVAMVRALGGSVWHVEWSVKNPAWMGEFARASPDTLEECMQRVGAHPSEWQWLQTQPDVRIMNNGTLDELFGTVARVVGESVSP